MTTGRTSSSGNEQMITPEFVFIRRLNIELKAGLVLAGILVFDAPKPVADEEIPDETQETIAGIIRALTQMAQGGHMPDDAVVFGWHGGSKPANAIDENHDALIAQWARDRLNIMVSAGDDPVPQGVLMDVLTGKISSNAETRDTALAMLQSTTPVKQ